MKMSLTCALAVATVLAGASLTAQSAAAQSWKKGARHYDDRGWSRSYHRRHRYYSRREIDRLPIRVTRPPGTSHYVFDNYPLWAARAFQPNLNR